MPLVQLCDVLVLVCPSDKRGRHRIDVGNGPETGLHSVRWDDLGRKGEKREHISEGGEHDENLKERK